MAVGGPDDDGAPSSSRDPPPQASEGGERTQQRAWFATHVRPAFVEPQRHARFGQSADGKRVRRLCRAADTLLRPPQTKRRAPSWQPTATASLPPCSPPTSVSM